MTVADRLFISKSAHGRILIIYLAGQELPTPAPARTAQRERIPPP